MKPQIYKPQTQQLQLKMDNIPTDLIPLIFNNIKLISDRRQFLRTCKTIYIITKQLMTQHENNFKQINDYSMEKFTLELCHDKYFHLMPESYLTPNNIIIVSALAASGNIELLQIAMNNGCELINSDFVPSHLHARKYDVSSIHDTCALAAQNGHLNVIEFCLNNGCNLNWVSCLMAAKNGQLKTLKWLKYIICEGHEYDISGIAAYYGHYDVLKWLIENECEINQTTCYAAVEAGHLNILKLLKENGCVLDEIVTNDAVYYGHLNILKWLKENDGKFTGDLCNTAALVGNLDILIWLKENGFSVTGETCSAAAENGHLNIIKWLIENGCEHHKSAIALYAAYGGFIHIFEWLITNNHKLNKDFIFDRAEIHRYTHVLEWLTKNGYIRDENRVMTYEI